MEEEDKIVLNFHDSLLKQSDVKLLQSPCWLNDKLIGFAFEYYERILFTKFSEQVVYISPDVAQFIKFGEGAELGIFLEPLALEKRDFVFLAINDNTSCESAGGSHWSLLVYKRAAMEFCHYDSACGHNKQAAQSIAAKVEPYLQALSPVTLVESSCPQQQNSHDCGVYVICIAEQLSHEFLEGLNSNLHDTLTPSTVAQHRKKLVDLIHKLAKEGFR